jgi:hypothetical protein
MDNGEKILANTAAYYSEMEITQNKVSQQWVYDKTMFLVLNHVYC